MGSALVLKGQGIQKMSVKELGDMKKTAPEKIVIAAKLKEKTSASNQ